MSCCTTTVLPSSQPPRVTQPPNMAMPYLTRNSSPPPPGSVSAVPTRLFLNRTPGAPKAVVLRIGPLVSWTSAGRENSHRDFNERASLITPLSWRQTGRFACYSIRPCTRYHRDIPQNIAVAFCHTLLHAIPGVR